MNSVNNIPPHSLLKDKICNLVQYVQDSLSEEMEREVKDMILDKFKKLHSDAGYFELFVQTVLLPHWDPVKGEMRWDDLEKMKESITGKDSYGTWLRAQLMSKEALLLENKVMAYEFPAPIKQRIRQYFTMFAEVCITYGNNS
jgi:hypothetical protein